MSDAHLAHRFAEVRRRARVSLFVLVPLLLAAGCPKGGDSTGNTNTVAITIASGLGAGNGKVSGSGYSCDIVGSLASGTCAKQIALNAQIALAATASAGSVFAGWGGACAAATGTCLVTATAAATATARFELETKALSVTSGGGTGNGTVTGSGVNCSIAAATQSGTCTVDLVTGTNVVLTAAAAAGHTFESWGGACSGAALTCNVTMSAAQSVTARFVAPPVALTVTSGGGTGNGSVSGGGIACNIVAATQNGTCSVTVLTGTLVTLTAAPAASNVFAGWGGGVCSGTALTCDVTMSQARTVTANFTPSTFALTVTSGGGTGSGAVTATNIACNIVAAIQTGTCSSSFTSGTVVVLTAAATAGHTFAGWGGGVCTGVVVTCSVTMSQARTVTASFTAPAGTFALTVTSGGGNGNGTVTATNIACNIAAATQSGTCAAFFANNTVVTLTEAPSAGQTFAGWGGGVCTGTATTCNVTMSQARTVTASFTAPVNGVALTITSGGGNGNGNVSGSGLNCDIAGVTQSGTCSTIVSAGTQVTLTSTPSVGGHLFAAWGGGVCTGNATTCVVTMSQARTVTASYTAPVALTVSATGTGTGSVAGGGIACTITGGVASGTCSVNVAVGTQVTLTETPAANNTFASWGGACGGSATTCNVTVDAATSVTAGFTPPPQFALTVTANTVGNGEGTVSGNGIACSVALNGSHVGSQSGTCSLSYNQNTVVTLTATATAGGYTFEGWTTTAGTCTGTTTPCSVTMSAARAVTAKFNAPSLATVQTQVFGVYCASCHGTPQPFATANGSYAAIVNQPSHSTGGWFLANTYTTIVVPYSAVTSYIIYQMQKNAGADPMPTSATVVPGSLIGLVINWINGGAKQVQP